MTLFMQDMEGKTMSKACLALLRSGLALDATKVAVGCTTIAVEGVLSAAAVLTLIEIGLIAWHFAHKKELA